MMFPRLLTLALTAVVLVPSGAHVFEMPRKIGLDREAYYTVQAIYAGWVWFAIPIFAAIVLNGALFVIERRRNPASARAALISALLIIASLGVFFVWVFSANQATANWTQVPDNWQELRRQWEYGHGVNALIVFAALLATGRAIMASPNNGV
jgi:predicted PurR-regulated permease PerM